MEAKIIEILNQIRDFVWGLPLIILLLGTGIFLTIKIKVLQIRALPYSLYLALIKRKEDSDEAGDITHFQALMTALAATVGTGNIAGVATAITMGGPGALFWMWITGLFGMATKYSEAVLAVKYRELDKFGTMSGGPMYYISKGLGLKWLGVLFAVFASIAAFGIGNMVQSNSVAEAIRSAFHIPNWISGIILAFLTALVVIGGIRSIANVTQYLVPFMVVFYFLGGFLVLFLNYTRIPEIFWLIIKSAFTPTAAAGGFLGATVMQTVRMGIARGIFSNESGLGSAPIAAAAAKTPNPVNQALVSMTQTFIDTIVVCSITGFVILSSGEWTSGITGSELTYIGFNKFLPLNLGGMIVTLGLIFFAYSTILGWCYYGEKSIEYLFGENAVKPYRFIFVIFVLIGTILKLETVWTVADIMNGLMALPNLIGLIGLSGVIAYETNKYFYSKKI
ncbi:sodium:alanine symporter family protein [Candidatus Aminicenantes bacterium AC-335-B20]|jgi:AGCS family alanine or glycine:cation symporter|nr:sodium:alanine symporter family protein [SCandidatus Aminicenantes bacterium Aminicenantia_JdfR_composite]MCP2596433.1 sodium:alanine symporter family protein [Candidatus Aminicenantes bacterium AC-335-G13]MCP2599225.1 sodium:alanine symporter family protein [Candidatus Aminicenantes bacterium AC-335-B20]MCP2618189.1 sodium:alanine symporter family protein [Candidatus Aminicenantes bacterium AC-335-A11]